MLNQNTKKHFLFLVAIPFLFAQCKQKTYDKPHIKIQTEYGDIEAELFPSQAPKTVAAFLKNVNQKVYDGGSFYRVLKNEDLSEEYNSGMIQGGIYQSKPGIEKTLPFINHESPRQTGVSHTSGTLSMARTDTGTAKSEFFICIGDQTQFDSSRRTNPDGMGYAAFGRVISGMSVVRKIQGLKNNGDQIMFPAVIKKITVL